MLTGWWRGRRRASPRAAARGGTPRLRAGTSSSTVGVLPRASRERVAVGGPGGGPLESVARLLPLAVSCWLLFAASSLAQASGSISSVAWGVPQEGVSWNVVVSGTASYPGNLFMVVKDGPATCGSIPTLDGTYPSSWSVSGTGAFSVTIPGAPTRVGTQTVCFYLGSRDNIPAWSTRSSIVTATRGPGRLSRPQLFGSVAQFEQAHLVVLGDPEGRSYSKLRVYSMDGACPAPAHLKDFDFSPGQLLLDEDQYTSSPIEVGRSIWLDDPGARWVCAYLTSQSSPYAVRAVSALPVEVTSNMFNPAFTRQVQDRCSRRGAEPVSGLVGAWTLQNAFTASWQRAPVGHVDSLVVSSSSDGTQRKLVFEPLGVTSAHSGVFEGYGKAQTPNPFGSSGSLTTFGLTSATMPSGMPRSPVSVTVERECSGSMGTKASIEVARPPWPKSRMPTLIGATRVNKKGGRVALVTLVDPIAGGFLEQTATYRWRAGKARRTLRACSSSQVIPGVGRRTVSCVLSKRALSHARTNGLSLTLSLMFREPGPDPEDHTDASPASTKRAVRLMPASAR